MKAVDAALYEIELGTDSRASVKVDKGARGQTGYAQFEPAFDQRLWLRKAKLMVVDRQKTKNAKAIPSWIVFKDIEDENVHLLVKYKKAPFMVAEVSVTLVQPINLGYEAASSVDAGNWEVIAEINEPRDLVKATKVTWGSGRHVDALGEDFRTGTADPEPTPPA